MIVYFGTDPADAAWHATHGFPAGTITTNHPVHAVSVAASDRYLEPGEVVIVIVDTDDCVEALEPLRFYPNPPRLPVPLRFFRLYEAVPPERITIYQRQQRESNE